MEKKMAVLKLIITIALTMAITMALINQNPPLHQEASENQTLTPSPPPPPLKRASRFLAAENQKPRNPKAADHCHKNPEVCYYQGGGGGANSTTCCNNKCVDLAYDSHNCGSCKNKCKFSQACCRGQCVYLAYDKRHCGECNHRCELGEYCVYGLCNYA